jgi:hypothetical protein
MWQVHFAAKPFVISCPNKPTISSKGLTLYRKHPENTEIKAIKDSASATHRRRAPGVSAELIELHAQILHAGERIPPLATTRRPQTHHLAS